MAKFRADLRGKRQERDAGVSPLRRAMRPRGFGRDDGVAGAGQRKGRAQCGVRSLRRRSKGRNDRQERKQILSGITKKA
jgi:hypothetical protein